MIGQTFEPGTDSDLRQSLNGQTGTLSPTAQQALRVLSLHLPSVLAGRPPAAADLLKPRVGGASPSSGVLDSLRGSIGAGAGMPGGDQPGMSGKKTELMQLMDLLSSVLGPNPNFNFISDPNKSMNLETPLDGTRNTGISGYGFPNGRPAPPLDPMSGNGDGGGGFGG